MFQPKTSPTSFPGPLVFPSPGAREEGKTRGPGNEVETSLVIKTVFQDRPWARNNFE